MGANGLRGNSKIAVAALNDQPVAADGVVVSAQEEVHVMPVLRQAPAVIAPDGAGADDGDDRILRKHDSCRRV